MNDAHINAAMKSYKYAFKRVSQLLITENNLININLGGIGEVYPPPPPCWFSCNNSEMVIAGSLEFSI